MENNFDEATRTINSLPVCPDDEIIAAVPRHQLSLRRQIDQLMAESGRIPLSLFRRNARILRKRLFRQKMFYSYLRVGVEECGALTWMAKPNDLLNLANELKERAKGLKDPWLVFAILLSAGYALAHLLRIGEALKYANQCKVIIRSIPNPYFFMGEISALCYMLGRYREAISWARKAVKGVTGEYRKDLYASLLGYLTVSGNARYVQKIIRDTKLDKWGYRERLLLLRALANLNRGDFQGTALMAKRAMVQSKKEDIKAFFSIANFTLACSHAAAGRPKEAKELLRKHVPLFKKHHLTREYLTRKVILGDSDLTEEALNVPPLRLVHLFYQAKMTQRASDYRKALRYARSQRLFGIFCRLALFFPEPVLRLLQKGKNPGLPRTFLEMPVFQVEPPVYTIKFLGRLQISKGEKLLTKLRLKPKDSAFLIHLSFRKNQRVLLEELCRNFWPLSKKPSRNLSHLLVRIKKALMFPGHLLRIRGRFLAWNLYFANDYESFEEALAQAKVLERAGEWGFARREYLRAFVMFRGEPFKKMFDNWSEDKRQEILMQLDHETQVFVRSCREHNNQRDIDRVLGKVAKIIPKSKINKDIIELSNSLSNG